MTNSEFNKSKKYLKNKLPFNRFKLNENGKPYSSSYHGEPLFISINVETLFNIVTELMNQKKD